MIAQILRANGPVCVMYWSVLYSDYNWQLSQLIERRDPKHHWETSLVLRRVSSCLPFYEVT